MMLTHAPTELPAPTAAREGDDRVAHQVRLHALGWLVAANVVGLWLALLLVWPDAGLPLGSLTFGRWMPLHLNWQLYGWCSLPLLGALLHFFGDGPRSSRASPSAWVLGAWSSALLLGGVSWLNGTVSGKLFLDWHGWARPLLPAAMALAWVVLLRGARRRWRTWSNPRRCLGAVLLTVLAAVPWVLYWASGRGVYPSVNPHSGGATGASLLGSTLGIVSIFGLLPWLLGMHRSARTGSGAGYGVAWLLSWLVFSLLDHGHATHRSLFQIAGLAVLLVWIPLLPSWLHRYAWSAGARRWLRAASGWWALLVLSGWCLFLPGVAEQLKFTHALVAHAHLAMAGFVTSVNFAILNQLDPTRGLVRGFRWWQGGCLLHVATLSVLGLLEADHATEFFHGAAWVEGFHVLRLGAGAAMLAGSLLAWSEGRTR